MPSEQALRLRAHLPGDRRARASRGGRPAPVRPRRRSQGDRPPSRARSDVCVRSCGRGKGLRVPGALDPFELGRARDPRPAGLGGAGDGARRARSSQQFGTPVPRDRAARADPRASRGGDGRGGRSGRVGLTRPADPCAPGLRRRDRRPASSTLDRGPGLDETVPRPCAGCPASGPGPRNYVAMRAVRRARRVPGFGSRARSGRSAPIRPRSRRRGGRGAAVAARCTSGPRTPTNERAAGARTQSAGLAYAARPTAVLGAAHQVRCVAWPWSAPVLQLEIGA